MSKIIGIDLGTSTSEVAVLEGGRPKVIPDASGETIIPSVVGLAEDGTRLVGQDARDQMLLRPEHTAMEVKRLMGSNSQVRLGKKSYSPQEISSFIIKYLLECGESYLGEKIERAVITVPAYFTDEQRRATVEAGKLAGLKVERVINEPTAAALAYGIDNMEGNRYVLVYDLGGGTLDVTVLEMFEGVLEVKASSGNNQLGGKDFDEKLMDYVLEAFLKKEGVDLSRDRRAMARLKKEAEACKVALSHREEYPILLPFIAQKGGNPLALDLVVTRELFEGLVGDMVRSTLGPVEVALGDSDLDRDDIDVILLVGGSTRVPLVKRFLEEELGREPRALVDPDLAVVMGAALQGGIINQELSPEDDILITDVCPYTLGVEAISFVKNHLITDIYIPLIPRNTTIPVSREKDFSTSTDNQDSLEIRVYQGDAPKASENNFLGNFSLEDVPPGPAFSEKVRVRFTYDVNGILQVGGTLVSTGKEAGITIETAGLGPSEELDITSWKKAPRARKFRGIIRQAEKVLEKELPPGEKAGLKWAVDRLKRALIMDEEKEHLEELEEALIDLLYEVEE